MVPERGTPTMNGAGALGGLTGVSYSTSFRAWDRGYPPALPVELHEREAVR